MKSSAKKDISNLAGKQTNKSTSITAATSQSMGSAKKSKQIWSSCPWREGKRSVKKSASWRVDLSTPTFSLSPDPDHSPSANANARSLSCPSAPGIATTKKTQTIRLPVPMFQCSSVRPGSGLHPEFQCSTFSSAWLPRRRVRVLRALRREEALEETPTFQPKRRGLYSFPEQSMKL